MFVPAGSILPLGPVEQYISQKRGAPVELRIYPGADATFNLYEDEGTNYGYERGTSSTIKLYWNEGKQELVLGKTAGTFPGMPTSREFLIHRLGGAEKQQTVKYDGHELRVTLK